jgi:hypothetical protein
MPCVSEESRQEGAREVSHRARRDCNLCRKVDEMDMMNSLISAIMTFEQTAADRLFDDFVILAGIGLAVLIAVFIIKSFKKMFCREW